MEQNGEVLAGINSHPQANATRNTMENSTKKEWKRKLVGQMALLDSHSQTSHLVKLQEGIKMLDPVPRKQCFYCMLTHNQLAQDNSQFRT